MARDDWRIRIELEDDRAGGLLERLGLDLGSDARELANELEDERLAVTRDGDTVFVYAATGLQAEQARRIVEAQLAEEGLEARSVSIEHWLRVEERWNEAAKPPVRESGPVEGARRNPEVPPEEAATWEEEVAARG